MLNKCCIVFSYSLKESKFESQEALRCHTTPLVGVNTKVYINNPYGGILAIEEDNLWNTEI